MEHDWQPATIRNSILEESASSREQGLDNTPGEASIQADNVPLCFIMILSLV